MKQIKGLLGACLVAGALAVPAQAADVERIREKAVELAQALAAHRMDVEVMGKESDFERVYKDYAFLFTDSQIKRAHEAGAERLAMFLQEGAANLELVSYIDDLHNKQATDMLEYNGQELTKQRLLHLLARSPEAADRRKIYSTLKASFELDAIFRNQIVTLRNELSQEAGYESYADFYARRENVDLNRVTEEARAFLQESEAVYEELFAAVAQERLGEEPRRVKFLDFEYLLLPAEENPVGESYRKVAGGLGVPELVKRVRVDSKDRPGRVLGAGVYPLQVPEEVVVGVTPTGTALDISRGLKGLGQAGVFALSAQTRFEDAYLGPLAPRAALGYLFRHAGELSGAVPHGTLQAFSRLLEARRLAAQVVYEVALYRGDPEVEDLFRDIMREAYGSRLSSSDAKRRFEFATELRSVAEFRGLMAAHALVQSLTETLGEDWHSSGKLGEPLKAWFAAGCTLTYEDVLESRTTNPAAMIAGIQQLQ